MARGVRKSPLEKLTEQLNDVQASIEQYEAAIKTMKLKEKELMDDIEKEKFKVMVEMMKEKNLTLDDFKEWVENTEIIESA